MVCGPLVGTRLSLGQDATAEVRGGLIASLGYVDAFQSVRSSDIQPEVGLCIILRYAPAMTAKDPEVVLGLNKALFSCLEI